MKFEKLITKTLYWSINFFIVTFPFNMKLSHIYMVVHDACTRVYFFRITISHFFVTISHFMTCDKNCEIYAKSDFERMWITTFLLNTKSKCLGRCATFVFGDFFKTFSFLRFSHSKTVLFATTNFLAKNAFRKMRGFILIELRYEAKECLNV